MNYNFDEEINRKNTGSSKWDDTNAIFDEDILLPLWLADTDFRTPAFILKALKKRLEHPIIGYGSPNKEQLSGICEFFRTMVNFHFDSTDMLIFPGVISSIANTLLALTHEEDEVILELPHYIQLSNLITNNNRRIITHDLIYNEKTGEYSSNFEELEQKISPKTKLWIFCHPHNPTGKVWSKQEMLQIEKIVKKHNLFVISDEIHGFLNFPSFPYIPLASLSDEMRQRTVTVFSASKLSGIAGMFHAFAVAPNLELLVKLQKQQERAGLTFYRQQVLGMVTSSAAYSNENKEWIREEIAYIKKNRDFAIEYFKENLPKVIVTPSQGTFLLWINFKNLLLKPQEIYDKIFKDAKVALSKGITFGEKFDTFYRMNIGCPRDTLKKALIRIGDAFK